MRLFSVLSSHMITSASCPSLCTSLFSLWRFKASTTAWIAPCSPAMRLFSVFSRHMIMSAMHPNSCLISSSLWRCKYARRSWTPPGNESIMPCFIPFSTACLTRGPPTRRSACVSAPASALGMRSINTIDNISIIFTFAMLRASPRRRVATTTRSARTQFLRRKTGGR